VAEHGNTGFHFDETLLGGRKIDSAREEKGSKGLNVSASQPGIGPKNALAGNWGLLDQAILTLLRLETVSLIARICEVRTN
jgi:hypothetical protein